MKHRIILLLALFFCPSISWAQATLSSGLIEFMELSFTNLPTPTWNVRINDETNVVLYNPTFDSNQGRYNFDVPGGARFFVGGPQHLFTRPADDLTWGFIGVAGGQQFRATPQNGTPSSQMMMGIASTGISPGIFVNNLFTVTMSVVGISNPGQFSYYINDNTPNSAVGSTATPLLSTLQGLNSFNYSAGTQNFFNMAFSAPGLYQVDFQFSGTRTAANGGGTITSSVYRYTFDVAPFAVPEPSTWALIGVSTMGVAVGSWYARRRHRRAFDASIDSTN